MNGYGRELIWMAGTSLRTESPSAEEFLLLVKAIQKERTTNSKRTGANYR